MVAYTYWSNVDRSRSLDRQTIFVISYPKSGSTWVTRLLADILNSPSGGYMPSEDHNEVATEGQDRPGPYIVRKGHFVLIDDDKGPVVPRPHRLAWKQLTDERIVFLVRDPRDICVSGAYHWRTSIKEFMERMIKGDVAKCGRWDEYCKKWDEYLYGRHPNQIYLMYEDVLEYPKVELSELSCVKYRDVTDEIIQRQSFQSRAKQIGDNEQELRRNNMRKGIAGDWRNHFTDKMNDRMWSEFGWMMERLGYEY